MLGVLTVHNSGHIILHPFLLGDTCGERIDYVDIAVMAVLFQFGDKGEAILGYVAICVDMVEEVVEGLTHVVTNEKGFS